MSGTDTEPIATTSRWAVDPARSAVEFNVDTYWGLGTVEGCFDRFEGSYVRGPDGARIELTIDADSLETGNRMRDKHLRDEDFFDVDAHPQVRYTSTEIVERTDDTIAVSGYLEAAGRKVPVSFEATVAEEGDELEIETITEVDQRDLGMTRSPLGMIRPPATLHVAARLRPER
ncbi:MAG TPA: YceI family protein [Gaiellaceae bacterium]|nr:YceI family protein [Gaiellaceae bacterium]